MRIYSEIPLPRNCKGGGGIIMVIKRKGSFRISVKVNPDFGKCEFEPRKWFYLEYRTLNFRTSDYIPKHTWHCLKVCWEKEECEKIFNMLTK